MLAHVEPLAANFALEDLTDPRYQYMIRLRARYGTFLGKASQALRQQGDEITVDAVHVLVNAPLIEWCRVHADHHIRYVPSARTCSSMEIAEMGMLRVKFFGGSYSLAQPAQLLYPE